MGSIIFSSIFLSILLSLYLVVGSILCERYNLAWDKRVRVEYDFRKKSRKWIYLYLRMVNSSSCPKAPPLRYQRTSIQLNEQTNKQISGFSKPTIKNLRNATSFSPPSSLSSPLDKAPLIGRPVLESLSIPRWSTNGAGRWLADRWSWINSFWTSRK